MIASSVAARGADRDRSALRRKPLAPLVLLAILVCLLAAPGSALAAPASTSILARAQSNTVTWGGSTILTGTLMENADSTAVGGQWVRVERSSSGSPASWTLLATITTEDAQYATGQYTYLVYPRVLTYYRFAFLGTDAYAPIVSNTLLIRVRPALGRPVAPSSVRAGTRFAVSGSLKPRFAAGSRTVNVKVYRYRDGAWRLAKRLSAVNANSGSYSKYVLKLALSTKGKYRFKAYTVATDTWATATSSLSRTLVVK